MSNPFYTFVFLKNWGTHRTGFSVWLFNFGKTLGIAVRCLSVLVLVLSVCALLVDLGNSYSVGVTAGPVLIALWLGDWLARYLMRRAGAPL